MKTKFADSHSHILSEKLRDRAEQIVADLCTDGLAFIVEIGCDPDDAKQAVEFALKHERVYCAVGVHPHYAPQYTDEFETWLKKQNYNKLVAIGECGLDYHYDHSPRDVQREVFARQIRLSHELGLPLIVHSRDAFDDTFSVLKENKSLLANGVVMHCYSYGAAEVKKLLAEFGDGIYFSFSGALTYCKSYQSTEEARAALSAVPLDRIMAETDCPYLAPVPVRGTVNEPKNARYVIAHMAELLGKSFEDICALTLENTKRFFKI